MLKLLDKQSALKMQRTGLTVGEVIAMLETFDPAAPLLVRGENGGFEDVLGFRATDVDLNVNSAAGFGPHEVPEFGRRGDVQAVILRSAE